jgi:hypothetical protein
MSAGVLLLVAVVLAALLFLSWVLQPLPSFGDLHHGMREDALRCSPEELRRRVESNPLMTMVLAGREERGEILRLVAREPFTMEAQERAVELLSQGLHARGYLIRPGSVEEVWALEAALYALAVHELRY